MSIGQAAYYKREVVVAALRTGSRALSALPGSPPRLRSRRKRTRSRRPCRAACQRLQMSVRSGSRLPCAVAAAAGVRGIRVLVMLEVPQATCKYSNSNRVNSFCQLAADAVVSHSRVELHCPGAPRSCACVRVCELDSTATRRRRDAEHEEEQLVLSSPRVCFYHRRRDSPSLQQPWPSSLTSQRSRFVCARLLFQALSLCTRTRIHTPLYD